MDITEKMATNEGMFRRGQCDHQNIWTLNKEGRKKRTNDRNSTIELGRHVKRKRLFWKEEQIPEEVRDEKRKILEGMDKDWRQTINRNSGSF